MEVMGLDVSHYQQNIDWGKVAESGKKFVILKAMYEAQSHRKDEFFEFNYSEAGKYGLARGVYIFIASASIKDPKGDAEALLRILGDRPLEYGIWLDFESKALRSQGKEKIKELAYLYGAIFKEAGYYVGIYCNKDWYDNVIHPELKHNFEFWIARYPKNDVGVFNPGSSLRPDYTIAVAWQYSSKGKVPGINGNVDLDVDFDGVVNLIAKEPYKKTDRAIAIEVLQNKWGTAKTSPTRKELLTMAGYNYDTIQEMVNYLLKKRPDREIVTEVLEGKWGTKDTSPTREELLTLCGYDYNKIQKLVNEWLA